MFELNETLKKDCIVLGDFPLCKVLLMNNVSVPWFILVPKEEDASELIDLTDEHRLMLNFESDRVSHFLKEELAADKLNVAAIGNIVPQLHIHHVARYKNDPCWPAPVWGNLEANPYSAEALQDLKDRFETYMQGKSFTPLRLGEE